MRKRLLKIVLLLFSGIAAVFAQDSTKTSSGLEGPVNYKAEKITVDPDTRLMHLRGKAEIHYENYRLKSGQININWTENLIHASPDTGVDSTGTTVIFDYPVFIEGGRDTLYADHLIFNIKTGEGKLFEGKSHQNNNYYRGEKMRKIDDETLLIRTGKFTTCALDTPHYYFASSKMQMTLDDKIVAKDIALYIQEVPLLYLPFGVFPNRQGRHSGFLVPRFEESPTRGRTLRNIGYYWVINDYMDATFSADFFEKRNLLYRGEYRYVDRYKYSGYVKAEYSPLDLTTGKPVNRWSFVFQHNQKISPNTNLTARGQFVSDNSYYSDNYATIDKRLNQQLSSTLTYSTKWPESKNSLNINLQSQQNLVTDALSLTLPDIRFSHSQRPLFGKPRGRKKLYHNIYYNYNASAKNQFRRDFIETVIDDSTTTTTKNESEKRGVRHLINLSAPIKIFKYITFSPNINYTEVWQDKFIEKFVNDSGEIVTIEKDGFTARRTFTSSLNTRTTVYGIFPIRIGSLRSIRHKMDPNISMNFRPDFSDAAWGYYATYTDTAGNEIRYDRFGESIYGNTPTGSSASISYSLANLFQAKSVVDGNDVKSDLFRVNMSGSYNLTATQFRLSDFRTSITANATKNFTLQAGFTHSPYKYGADGRGRIDEFLGWENGLIRLVDFNASGGFSITGKELSKSFSTLADSLEDEERDFITGGDVVSERRKEDTIRDLKASSFSWTLRADVSYRYNASDRNNIIQDLDIVPSVTLTLTENWRISWRASMDILDKKLNFQSYSIYRDLHCWELSFNWSPNSNYPESSYFYFRIGIKDPILKDLKLEQTSSGTPLY